MRRPFAVLRCHCNVPNRRRAVKVPKPPDSIFSNRCQVRPVLLPARPAVCSAITIIRPRSTTMTQHSCRVTSRARRPPIPKVHHNCALCAATRPPANTTAFVRAKDAKASSSAPYKRARNTSAWPINRVRSTNVDATVANSVDSKNVLPSAW